MRNGSESGKPSYSSSHDQAFNAREVTVTVNRTVLDCEIEKRHVPIGYTFRRSTTTVGEWVLSQAILRKDASQPVQINNSVGADVGRRPHQHSDLEQPGRPAGSRRSRMRLRGSRTMEALPTECLPSGTEEVTRPWQRGRTLITLTPVDRSRARNNRVEFAKFTAIALQRRTG
jgi:hypothetical protein